MRAHRSFVTNAHDANGVSLSAYLDTLMEKYDQALPTATITIIMAHPNDDGVSGEVEIMSNIEQVALASALMQLGKDLSKQGNVTPEKEIN